MIFSLDVRRALKGDCLLLHYGTKEKPGLVMIDGGPSGVYEPHLRPRLEEIRAARGLSGNKALPVNLLMVSHVDDDHIQGILDFTRELLEAKRDQEPQFVKVQNLWHNSFNEIIDHKPEELTAAINRHDPTASVSGGEMSDDKKADVEASFAGTDPGLTSEEEDELVSSSLKVLASIPQGFQLRVDAIDGLEWPLNAHFGGNLIVAKEGGKTVDLGQGLTFKVAGPMLKEVEALRRKHNEWLQRLDDAGEALPEHQALAAYIDKSVPNLSSLVFLAEAGGKTMLLTGDARGDKVLQGLELTGLLDEGGTMQVDVLKVPHHGSSNNLDNDFFERVLARHYVFSGDGEHGNPERESLEMLFEARGDEDYTIHLTYPIDELDEGRKEDWKKERAKQQKKKLKNPDQKVRPVWSKEKNSLRAFFDSHPGLEDKVSIVDEVKPHVIDLLDPLGI